MDAFEKDREYFFQDRKWTTGSNSKAQRCHQGNERASPRNDVRRKEMIKFKNSYRYMILKSGQVQDWIFGKFIIIWLRLFINGLNFPERPTAENLGLCPSSD